MRKNFGTKPWMYPLPVLMIATYDKEEKANVMNAAWGGLYEANLIELCLSSNHKTTQNIMLKKSFTVSFATRNTVKACDYVGLVSANLISDKMEKAGFTTTKSDYVDAPIINELPMCLECKLVKVTEEGNIIGEIINVNADEAILDKNGTIDVQKLEPLIFDPIKNEYLSVGEKVGNAFKDGNELK